MAYQNMGQMRTQLNLQNSMAPGRNNSNYTGNPMGVYNSAPSSGQQQGNLGRYRPPTYTQGPNNQQNWNDQGGYEYNVPNSYGGPGNYYGQEGQGYGRQGMQQGYGGGGGGYRQGGMRPQFNNQEPYMWQPQTIGMQQQRPQFQGNPYSSGQLPSIMASYGAGEGQGGPSSVEDMTSYMTALGGLGEYGGNTNPASGLELLMGQQAGSMGGRVNNKGPAGLRPELSGGPQGGNFAQRPRFSNGYADDLGYGGGGGGYLGPGRWGNQYVSF